VRRKRAKAKEGVELKAGGSPFQFADDSRPRLAPPPPVQLVAVADVTLPAVAGLETQADAFYGGLLRLERDLGGGLDGLWLVYRAENFNLRLAIHEVRPPSVDYRPLGLVVPSLADLAARLAEAQIPYIRQRGLFAGTESLMLTDPSGNHVEVAEGRLVM
jgi:hypothetical protein